MAERAGFEPARGQGPPNGLANRPLQPLEYLSIKLAPPAGLEPATYRLTADRSTIELRRIICNGQISLYLSKNQNARGILRNLYLFTKRYSLKRLFQCTISL